MSASDSTTSTIKLSDDTVRFHQGAAAGHRVTEAHSSTEFPDVASQRAMYWFYVGALAAGEYGCNEAEEFSAFILGAKTVEPTVTTAVYVVSFSPSTEDGGVGGFEWRLTLDDARQEYDTQVANAKGDGRTQVRLLKMAVHNDPLYAGHTQAVSDELDSRIDELEDTGHALRQFIPVGSVYPPSGSADVIDGTV